MDDVTLEAQNNFNKYAKASNLRGVHEVSPKKINSPEFVVAG